MNENQTIHNELISILSTYFYDDIIDIIISYCTNIPLDEYIPYLIENYGTYAPEYFCNCSGGFLLEYKIYPNKEDIIFIDIMKHFLSLYDPKSYGYKSIYNIQTDLFINNYSLNKYIMWPKYYTTENVWIGFSSHEIECPSKVCNFENFSKSEYFYIHFVIDRAQYN